MVWLWAFLFIATLVFEIVTVEMISIWFSVGSLVSFILALCTKASVTVQIIVFIVVSFILLASARSICIKLLKNNKEKTNIESIVGSVYKLSKEIKDEEPGEVRVNDVVWRAYSIDETSIAAGKKVQVVKVSGNKFYVKEEK